ncbi:MAG: putative indolepyruvate oxidoreductase subunit [Thermoleophilia bacterium]|nr:putative indolepyruvate oxidoreductase subunit [Thermoleophilia bacterium]
MTGTLSEASRSDDHLDARDASTAEQIDTTKNVDSPRDAVPTRKTTPVRPWSALICGAPDDRTLLIVDWLLLACRSAGYVAAASPVIGGDRVPHGMYIEVSADVADAGSIGATPWGAVDLVVAGEHLELVRAIDAGFVARDATTVVASCRRGFTPAERSVAPQHVLGEREIDALAASSAAAYHAFDGPEVARWYDLPATAQPALLFGAVLGTGVTGLDEDACRSAIDQLGIDADLFGTAFGRGVRLGRRAGGRIRRQRTAYQFTRRRRATLPAASRRQFEELVARAEQIVEPHDVPALQEAIYLLSEFHDAAWAARLVEYVAELARLELAANGGAARGDASIVRDSIRSLAALKVWPDSEWVAQRKLRRSRHQELRGTQRITRRDTYELVDYIPLDARDLADMRLPRFRGAMVPDVAPLLQPVQVRALRSTSIAGAWTLRRMARSRRWRADSSRFELEVSTLEAWRATLIEALSVDHELARIVAASGTLVQGTGAVREAHRQTAQAFWGRIVRQSIALDRADPTAAAPIARHVVPFVWEQLSRSGPLALWEFAAQVLGIALACSRGLPHEQAVAMAHEMCAPRVTAGLGEV